MNRKALAFLLAFLGSSLMVAVLLLRPSTPVAAPPPPVHPVKPPSSDVPLIPPKPPPPAPAQEAEDPLLTRWRAAVRNRTAPEVATVQSMFLARENEYREPLMAVAKTDEDPRVRAFTVAVLGRMKHPPAEPYFLERTGDAHEFPRTSAVQALEKIGTKASLVPLDRLSKTDPAPAVRAAAAQSAKAVRSR